MSAVFEGKDKNMILESNRLKSFRMWPFAEGKCTKKAMARSGFYHCNISGELDGVRCFCCLKELDGWDATDDPWLEHRRNNNCLFANLAKPQDQLTVKELLKVIEEREINLMVWYDSTSRAIDSTIDLLAEQTIPNNARITRQNYN